MPDWRHEAKTLIQAGKGIRESARALNLPEDRVRKWAERAGIRSQIVADTLNVAKLSPQVKIVANVATAGDVLQGDAETLGPDARHIAARIGHKQLSAIDNTMTADPSENALQVDSALTSAKLLQTANVPGWERQDRAPATQVLVQVGLMDLAPPVIVGTDDHSQSV